MHHQTGNPSPNLMADSPAMVRCLSESKPYTKAISWEKLGSNRGHSPERRIDILYDEVTDVIHRSIAINSSGSRASIVRGLAVHLRHQASVVDDDIILITGHMKENVECAVSATRTVDGGSSTYPSRSPPPSIDANERSVSDDGSAGDKSLSSISS